MKEKIISIIVTFIIIMSCITALVFAAAPVVTSDNISNPTTTISEDYIPSEPTTEAETILENVEVERVEPTTYEEALSFLETATLRQESANSVYNGLVTLGYAENHPAMVMAKTDIETTQADLNYYQEQITIWSEKIKWEKRAAEYPVATQVWLYMKNEFGWSDTVCAGIMGNMMAECGGCWTSDLDWDVNSSNGFGMIQWLGDRKRQLFSIYGESPSIENQLHFMKDELYGTNGVTKQVTDSQLNKIMNAKSPEDCAFAFATYFERCGEGHRAIRKGYARRAYEYFVG